MENRLNNVASERAVLAGVAHYGIDCWADIENLLEEKTFTSDINKVVFKCMQKSLQTSNLVDFSSILSAANDLNLYTYLQDKNGIGHIETILETPIYLENVKEHAQKIRRLQFGREIQASLREANKAVGEITGDENLTSIVSLAENPVQELSLKYLKGDNNRPEIIGQDLDAYIQHLIDHPADQIGLSTGFPSFDISIGGGLRRGCVDLITARTGIGKSIFCDNVALYNCTKSIPVLVLDTEMGKTDHYNRLLANISNVEINEIGSGRFSKNHTKLSQVMKGKEFLKKLPYHYISVSGKPFEEMLSIARRWILKEVGFENGRTKDCLIIYDYMKLMSSDGIQSMQEYQALGFQITQLHNFCVKHDVPCLSFVQANRDGITKESTDIASGSDRLVWLCTSFSLLKEKTEEEISVDGILAGNRKLIPLKTRHGPGLSRGYICLQMDGDFARLRHLGTIKEVKAKNGNGGYRRTEVENDDED